MLVFPAALAAFALSGSKNYALISFAMVIMAIVPFLMLYEMKKPQAREWIPLAVMAAIAAVGRAAFAALPHFKPVSAIIIITAMTFGPEAGFLTGARPWALRRDIPCRFRNPICACICTDRLRD